MVPQAPLKVEVEDAKGKGWVAQHDNTLHNIIMALVTKPYGKSMPVETLIVKLRFTNQDDTSLKEEGVRKTLVKTIV